MTITRVRTGKQIVGAFLLRSVVALTALAAVAYLVDSALFQYRLSNGVNALGTVSVHPYLAVPLKNKSTEMMADSPRDQPCANSLFPHSGYPACWYLRDHRNDPLTN